MGGSMTKVLSGLYVGALDNTKNEEELMANVISRILVVQNEKYEIEKSPGRHYLQVVVNEQNDRALLRCLPETNDFIHAARLTSDNVLVCSDSGMSASVAVVAAYLMSVYHLDSRSAVSVVQGLRHAANPVASLQDQLERFENGELTGNGVIGRSPARHPSGTTTSELSGASQQQLTVEVEHARLIDKFGTWPRLDEDLQAIGIALKSHKTLSDSGFYLYDDPDDPADPSMEPKQLGDQGDVPQSRSRPLAEDDKPCRVQEAIDIPRSDSLDPDRSSGTDTIGHSSNCLANPPLDPNDEGLFDSEPVFGDPVTAEALPSPTVLNESDPAHTNRNRIANLTVPSSGSEGVDEGLEADEIGFELDEDAVAEEDEDNDEVPGAVSIPTGSSARRSVAASYHHAGLSSRNMDHSRMGYSLASNTQYHTNVGSVTRTAYQPSVRNPTTVPINNTDPRLSTTAPLRRTFW